MNRRAVDSRFRSMMTPQMAELLSAYEEHTKRMVSLDYLRLDALARLAIHDITIDDIWLIVRYVRKRIRSGDNRNKVGTFTPASLEFGNLFGDFGRFEDRLQTARLEYSEKRIVKNKIVAVTRPTLDGSLSRLEEQRAERAPTQTRTAVADALRMIADNLL